MSSSKAKKIKEVQDKLDGKESVETLAKRLRSMTLKLRRWQAERDEFSANEKELSNKIDQLYKDIRSVEVDLLLRAAGDD